MEKTYTSVNLPSIYTLFTKFYKTENFTLILTQELGHLPTSDQKKAIKKLSEFVLQPNSQEGFVFQGYAGTGKTSLIGALVRSLVAIKMKSVLLAPTGRAAKVLATHSKKEAFTIHKKIYFQEEFEGMSQFVLGKNLHTNTIFIIDEASMVSSDAGITSGSFEQRNLLNDLIRYVYNGKNCKLIFVGDYAQLPPVGLVTSPALDAAYLEGRYGISFVLSELKDVVRQEKESGILFNATNLRAQIEKDSGFELKINPNFPDTFRISGMELQDELESCVSKYGIEGTMVVCRSNKRANLFNKQIRNRALWMEDELSSGDLMMIVKNNYHWLDEKSKMGFIANGDIVKILRVSRYEELYGFRFADVTIQFLDAKDEPELECKILLETIDVEAPNLPRDRMKELFYAIEEDFLDVRSRKKRYDLIMKTPHMNALQVKFAYAVTCHKAQGGQWPAVFIDQGYLTEEMLDKEYVRWLYTAVTRATDKLYFVNFNKVFYEGEE